ncbi:ABC transporter substrate-binding protein [Amycolatopsis sp. K13G38]|uniref:ABC transporter substrate-binding protein n=1 Tax=Amycolatopsis acididurans TaxID=2724524 RepID=A0ABX1JD58_9PSEU|nr:helix-turn-helix domain-containing protein [Amycolatopsis acididurans]NKQ57722.1 ABC transporter substrate-binding protein [Amycolatopsis acididurans]
MRTRAAGDPEGVVAAHLTTIGATLNDDLPALVQQLYARLVEEIEELRGDERLLRLMNSTIEGNLSTVLHLLQHGIEVDRVDVPATAIEYAHRLAQNGVPVQALVRAYRLGQDSFLQRGLELLTSEVTDVRLVAATAQRLTAITFDYIDRVTEQVLAAYQDERERWLRRRNADREALVHELLRGKAVDLRTAETTLGYQLLGRRHLGLVVWAPPEERFEPGGPGLERLTHELAHRLGCALSPLFLSPDQVTVWAWFPMEGPSPTGADFRSALDALGRRIRVAVGQPGAGVEGFTRSHDQASQVQRALLVAGSAAASAADFGEVGPIALLCEDLPATRAWVIEILGRLAADDESHARLRETLRVFLLTGGSYVAAAEKLALHRNSVHYRVRKAEEERGRPIDPDRLDVEIALKACHWLGRSVLL